MGIIQKAGDFTGSTMVMGLPADGKTTVVMNELVEKNLNPLWIVFTNGDIVSKQHPEWAMAVMANWYQFDNLYKAMKTGVEDIKAYNAVVIEGLGYAATMALTDILSKSDTKDPRPSYLEMGRTLNARLAELRSMFGSVYCTMDLDRTKENNLELLINPHLYNSIIGFFGRKVYVYSEPTADKKSVNYIVQDNPTFALRFKPTLRKED